ncbi:MAG: MFS transporter [Gammaproteobacteria bacterium]|nr:MFS transporter [Gammaproteobacteria bacterium]
MSANRGEFRVGWLALCAATAGMSSGLALNAYINNIFAPYLLEAFDWSKSALALNGAISIITVLWIPFIGRMADIYGVRTVAIFGIVGYPCSFVLMSLLTGDVRELYAIHFLQVIFCASTTATVYCRVVAEKFSRHRGLALAICAAGPAVAGAIASPLLTPYIIANGWRAGFQAMAVFSGLLGVLTLILLPPKQDCRTSAPSQYSARKDYRAIFTNPAFRIIAVSSFLCSLTHALATSQVKIVLADHGVTPVEAGYMVSVFAVGVILGRLIAGVALDKWPTHIVAAIGMGLPFLGSYILATDTTHLILLGFAIILIGLSFGAEADILAYVTARYFPMHIYSSVMGLLTMAVGLAIGLGSGLLSYMLSQTDSFTAFLIFGGTLVLIGSLNLLRLGSIELANRQEIKAA